MEPRPFIRLLILNVINWFIFGHGVVIYYLFYLSGISINITEANGLLTIATLIPKTFEGKTSGLLGNFNGDPDDDLIPRGATTSLASNSTDREIFFNFGKTCKL